MKITKIGMTVRIGRNYDYQTVAYEQIEEVELELGDDRDQIMGEIRDRGFLEVIAATNKAYAKLVELRSAEKK